MARCQLKFIVCFLGVLTFGASPLMAQEILTLTFDSVPLGVVCDQVWDEQGVNISFTTTAPEDCDGGGNCSFDATPGEPIWLFPGRLLIDFGDTYLIYRVEVDVLDYCGIGCTQTFLYDDGGGLVGSDANNTSSAPEVLVIDLGAGGAMARELAISSCEGQILRSTVRVYSSTVDDDNPSWSKVKATFR